MAYENSMSNPLFYLFLFLLILFYYVFTANPYGILKHFRVSVMILCLLTVFGFLIFIEYYTKQEMYQGDTFKELGINFMKYSYKYGFYLFYLSMIAIITYGIYQIIVKGILFTFQYSFWVTLGLLILILSLFTQTTKKESFDSPTLELIKTLIMYIPCLITDAIDFIKQDYENTPSTVMIVFILIVLYVLLFYVYPLFVQIQFEQDGILLISSPRYLNQDVFSITSDELKEKILESRPFYDRWFQNWALKQEEERVKDAPIQLEGKQDQDQDSLQLIVPPDSITYPYYARARESFTSLANQDSQWLSLDVFKERIRELYDVSDPYSDDTAKERMNQFIIDHPSILTLLEKMTYLSSVAFASWDTLLYSPQVLFAGTQIPRNIYHYALTSWVYLQNIDSRDMQLIYSFGSRPSLYYDPVIPALLVITNYGKPNQKIIYKTTQILYQRWNFIVMNYNYGTLDLFVNNHLVGTYPQVVTRLDPDDLLIVGSSKNKNIGGICNMKYYELPIGSRKIHQIYTAFHNKKIPL